MTTETKRVSVAEQDKSMESLAAILGEHGITAVQCIEAWEEGVRHIPTITLGFDDDGLEAAEIACEHGYPLGRVSYRYNYLNGLRSKPYWVMEILTSDSVVVG